MQWWEKHGSPNAADKQEAAYLSRNKVKKGIKEKVQNRYLRYQIFRNTQISKVINNINILQVKTALYIVLSLFFCFRLIFFFFYLVEKCKPIIVEKPQETNP